MNLYAEQKPKKFNEYHSHYATILSWDRLKQDRESKSKSEKPDFLKKDKYGQDWNKEPDMISDNTMCDEDEK